MIQPIEAASTIGGTVHLPADKSISHRAAMFASLHAGTSTIHNFSEAADPHSTLLCLRQLGVTIRESGQTLRIEGVGRDGLREPAQPLDCGNSGTTMRLLSGIIAGAGVEATLEGDESLSARTMKRIIDPLCAMGASISARNDDFAPLHISRNGPLQALHFSLPIASAQLKSCVLLAGLFGEAETTVIETETSRDHTERLLHLPVVGEDGEKIITSSRGCAIPEQSYTIPGDFSAAAFWLVAGSIHRQAAIELESVGMNPTRTGALDILQRMGADITVLNERMEGAEPVADLQVRSSRLEPVEITPGMVPNCIDELPVLCVAMLFADGTSRIRGAAELRHKETDRLRAMGRVLRAAGAPHEEYEDGFKIHGSPGFSPEGALYASEHDHRIAMSAAVLALMGSGPSRVRDAECTAISYPSFWDDLRVLTN